MDVLAKRWPLRHYHTNQVGTVDSEIGRLTNWCRKHEPYYLREYVANLVSRIGREFDLKLASYSSTKLLSKIARLSPFG